MTPVSGAPHQPNSAFRHLPAVDHLLRQPVVAQLVGDFPRGEVLRAVRQVIEQRRTALARGESPPLDVPELALEIRGVLHDRARASLRRVINATGIVLHTGLGRAPLHESAVEAIAEVAGGYCNLELDLAAGDRGQRQDHLRDLLRELTGAEDASVVNNNAAATYLVLAALAGDGGEVIISRGQLVEIGGSYRMPDIMAAAGCRMVEVGATNRTHLRDYEGAITERTRVLLHVHTSNYRIEGFTTSPTVGALADLARRYESLNLHVVDDLGSGLLDASLPGADDADAATPADRDMPRIADWDEPTVTQSVAAGAGLTLFSGDKLLGGPQAGIIVGRSALLRRLHAHPLMRTFRPDKLALAGLEATLRIYRDPAAAVRELPHLRMLTARPTVLRAAAEQLAEGITAAIAEAEVTCSAGASYAGGGSLPTLALPTWLVCVCVEDAPAHELAAALRRRDLPIIARVGDEALIFDCRTLTDEDARQIPGALAECVRECGPAA